eukprot:143630-Rhodomonas_salina.4
MQRAGGGDACSTENADTYNREYPHRAPCPPAHPSSPSARTHPSILFKIKILLSDGSRSVRA